MPTSSQRRTRRWHGRTEKRAETPPPAAAPQSLFVKTEYRLRQIGFDSILYIEGLKDYVKIHVEEETHPVLTLTSLNRWKNSCPPTGSSASTAPSSCSLRRSARSNATASSSARSTFPSRRTTGRRSSTFWPNTRCSSDLRTACNRQTRRSTSLPLHPLRLAVADRAQLLPPDGKTDEIGRIIGFDNIRFGEERAQVLHTPVAAILHRSADPVTETITITPRS